jgi:hypothetical protein
MKAKKMMGGGRNLPKKVKERPKSKKRKKTPKRNYKGYYFFKIPKNKENQRIVRL